MTSVNQPPASKKPSTNNAERLKELEKASLKSSRVQCTIDFIDCSDESTEIDSDGDRTDAVITNDQMRGIFLTVESTISEIKEIRRLVSIHAPDEEESCEIFGMIDDALKMLDFALRMGQVRFSNDADLDDEICLGQVWVNGFFCTLRHANDRMGWLFTRINDIRDRIVEGTKPDDNGGDLVKDDLH